MAHIIGTKGQANQDSFFDASGTIVAGGTAQLVLPVHPARSHFFFQNNSTHAMWLEFGSARAAVTISGGAVTAASVSTPNANCLSPNAGFNFTYPPIVRFLGGGNAGNSRYLGLGQPGGAAPTSQLKPGRTAAAHCVLTGGAVSSIVIDDPGAGYAIAPFAFIFNDELDPYGCAVPSSGVGVQVFAGGGSVYYNGTACFTDSVSVFGTTTADAYCCKWML